MEITNPGCISQQMFGNALQQGSIIASTGFSGNCTRSEVSEHTSSDRAREIVFVMGLQFGFVLALSYSPLLPS
jgi:hypothetical protein